MFNQSYSMWRGSGWSLWKPLLLVGLNLVVLAVLIFVFPTLLAYLIAAFLLFNGSLLIMAAHHLRAIEKRSQRQSEWELHL